MKNTNKGFVLPLVIVIMLVLGGGFYVYYQKSQPEKEIAVNTAPASEALNDIVSQNIKDDFIIPSDWQTYTNESFGLEIKYPKEFSITDMAGGNLLRVSVTNNLHKELNFPIIFNKSPSQPQESPEEVCKKYKSAESMEGRLLKCESFLLNGVSFIEVIQELKTGYGLGVSVSGKSNSTIFSAIPLIPKQFEDEYLNVIINIIKTIKIKN